MGSKKAFILNQNHARRYYTKHAFDKGDLQPGSVGNRQNSDILIVLGCLVGPTVACMLISIIGVILSDTGSNTVEDKAGVIALLLVVGFIFVLILNWVMIYIRSMFRYGLLDHRGQLLDGELLEATNRTEDGYRSANLTVTYTFMTPKKRTLICKQTHRRADLMNKPLPRKGTRVRVLYVGDNDFVML